jgi:hypothetical protein
MTAAVLQLSRLPARRGVKKYRGKVLGKNAYLAVTSARDLLHGTVYVVSDDMDDVALVTWLKRELDRVDPRVSRPRHLRVVPKSVSASIDGPSTTHPEILARVEIAHRETEEDLDLDAIVEMYPDDPVMQGVVIRMANHLRQRRA